MRRCQEGLVFVEPGVLAEDCSAEPDVVRPAEERVLEALLRGPALCAVEPVRSSPSAPSPRPEASSTADSLEASLQEVYTLGQLAIRIPFIDRIRRSGNRTVGIWRILDDDRRVQGPDEGVQVGMRRVVVVANVGLERAVCAQEAPDSCQ